MNPIYHKARYIKSIVYLRDAPTDKGFEVAFAGRSNAGKSSAINLITQQKNLARVSKTPGRTQLITFFYLDEERRLVDLPGYGYAKVSEKVRSTWKPMIETYLSRRRTLRGVFLLMDIRHPLTAFDRQMIEWCLHHTLPVHIALTKCDKLSRSGGLNVLHTTNQHVVSEYGKGVSVQLFSALRSTGIEEAHAILDGWLEYPTTTVSVKGDAV